MLNWDGVGDIHSFQRGIPKKATNRKKKSLGQFFLPNIDQQIRVLQAEIRSPRRGQVNLKASSAQATQAAF